MVYLMQAVLFALTIVLWPINALESFAAVKFKTSDEKMSFSVVSDPGVRKSMASESESMPFSQTEEESLQDLAKAIWKEAKGTEIRPVTVVITDTEGHLLSIGHEKN